MPIGNFTFCNNRVNNKQDRLDDLDPPDASERRARAMAPQPQHGSTTIEIPNVTFTRTSLASHVKPTGGGETTAKCAMACDGIVFDTTSGRDFYGPGGPYAALNGRDASRALATMKINVSEEEEALGVEGLSEDEVKTLREWRVKFEGKYPALGRYERGG